MTNPGMRALIMEGKRQGCDADRIQVRLEPSVKIKPGVFIAVNEHYDLTAETGTPPSELLRTMILRLQGTWDGFLAYRTEVAKQLFTAFQASRG